MPDASLVEAEPPCEVSRYGPHPGATKVFLGELVRRGNRVRGTEILVLRGNGEWHKQGGTDCVVHWKAAGTALETPVDCEDCNLAIDLTLRIDLEASTCPDTYIEHLDDEQTTRYHVWTEDDGNARLSFQSGTPMGDGHIDGRRIHYRTFTRCEWY